MSWSFTTTDSDVRLCVLSKEEMEFHFNPGEINQEKQFNTSGAPLWGFFLGGGEAAFDGKNKNRLDENKTQAIQLRTNKNNLQKQSSSFQIRMPE